jgi:site-specific recombinase XerD
MPRSPTETIRFLTLDEIARLFRAIGPHRRDRALFLIAYRHGLRASEVGLLRVEDIDLKTLRIMALVISAVPMQLFVPALVPGWCEIVPPRDDCCAG